MAYYIPNLVQYHGNLNFLEFTNTLRTEVTFVLSCLLDSHFPFIIYTFVNNIYSDNSNSLLSCQPFIAFKIIDVPYHISDIFHCLREGLV